MKPCSARGGCCGQASLCREVPLAKISAKLCEARGAKLLLCSGWQPCAVERDRALRLGLGLGLQAKAKAYWALRWRVPWVQTMTSNDIRLLPLGPACSTYLFSSIRTVEELWARVRSGVFVHKELLLAEEFPGGPELLRTTVAEQGKNLTQMAYYLVTYLIVWHESRSVGRS